MSNRFAFRMAQLSDDSEIRQVLRATSMPGALELSFQREPSFFLGEGVANVNSKVIVCEDLQTEKVVGFGVRAERLLYVNQQPRPIGYLSMLRALPEVRGGKLLGKAYHYLEDICRDDSLPYYLTTILDDNVLAKKILTSGRGGLPQYDYFGNFQTYLVPLYKRYREQNDVHVRPCTISDLPQVVAIINLRGQSSNFVPVLKEEDFLASTFNLGLDLADIWVYEKAGEILGLLAVWDQGKFKQTIVKSYASYMRVLKFFNPLIKLLSVGPKLPELNSCLPYLYATFVSVNNYDEDIFRALLARVLRSYSHRDWAYLIFGFFDEHPFATSVANLATIKIASSVYLVYWRQPESIFLPMADKVPHLEVSHL